MAETKLSPFLDGSPFHFDSSGIVYLVTRDCAKPIQWEGPRHSKTVKIEAFNKKDARPIGKSFLYAKGKIYDGFYPELKRQSTKRTSFLGTLIDAKTFMSLDKNGEYLKDKNNLFYSKYPNWDFCIHENLKPIQLTKLKINGQEELELYRDQSNHLYVSSGLPESHRYAKTWTPYAKLKTNLYWRDSRTGQYSKVIGADPLSFRSLVPGMHDLFTDGKLVFLHGKKTEVIPSTVRPIRCKSSNICFTNFFYANNGIYYLTEAAPNSSLSKLIETDADPESFEFLDTNGSWNGRVFRDKRFIYEIKRNSNTTTLKKKPRN